MSQQIMTGGLDEIVKRELEDAAKTDPQLATAMKTKKMDDCINAIYDAFVELAQRQNSAMSGDDSLIRSAAIHWFTEDKPTKESIVDILKGGTTVHKLSKQGASKESAPSKGKAKKQQTMVAPVAADDDFDVDGDDEEPTPAPAPEPKAEPTPKPTATPQTLFADDDFDVD
ncbi:MAG: hypothetical protein K6A67_11370 [Bacteroidales bacterium]|nr:hypothetical protein [Bacteroidales bacterium]